MFEIFSESTAENCLSGIFPSVLQIGEERWKNRAIKFQARVQMTLRRISLSSPIEICIDLVLRLNQMKGCSSTEVLSFSINLISLISPYMTEGDKVMITF